MKITFRVGDETFTQVYAGNLRLALEMFAVHQNWKLLIYSGESATFLTNYNKFVGVTWEVS